MVKRSRKFSIFRKKETKRNKDLLVAASVIAAMGYQAAISPPGGVAAVDASENNFFFIEPGASLLAVFYSNLSNVFWISNTISLLAALSVIFLYVSGASLKRKILIWLVRLAMWITLSSMTLAYACAVIATTPTETSFDDISNTLRALIIGVIAWMALIFLSLFVLVFRFIRYLVRKITKKKKSTSEGQVQVAAPDNDIV